MVYLLKKLVYVFLDRTTPDSSQEKTKPGMVTAGGAAPQQRDALCLLAERNAGERAEAEKAFDQMKVEGKGNRVPRDGDNSFVAVFFGQEVGDTE